MGRARGRAVGPCRAGPGRGLRRGWSSARGWVAIHPAYNIHPVRDPGRTGVRGRSAHTSGQTEVVERWKGGRWRFHGLFRAHTSNHVRAFARLSTYFRVPGDFDEWCGEMYRHRRKKMRQKSRKRPAAAGEREISQKESQARLASKGSYAAKGRTGWEIIGRSVRGV